MRNWTKEQYAAINAKWQDDKKTLSSNILVNAAAGSGKTAVLVERIINKICADSNSVDFCDISNLLVVTFTNAAAKEMKQRISDALNQKIADAIKNNDIVTCEHLKKQIKSINQADITTIDSFCLKIVKSYFHLINIDPDFRIAESAECELMKDEVIEELFDELYCDDDFIRLAFTLTDGRDTTEIADLIKSLFNFTRSLPDPDKWFEEKRNQICINDENNIYFGIVKNKITQELEYASQLLLQALKTIISICFDLNSDISDREVVSILSQFPPEDENDVYLSFGTYYTAIYNEYFYVLSLLEKKWDDMYKQFTTISFIDLRTSPIFKDKDKIIKDKEILGLLKSYRDSAKESILNAKSYVTNSTEEIFKISQENIYPLICSLIVLCKKFEEKYNNKKSSKNALEFSDIEHLCLKIIRNNEEVKNALREKYSEILIDEYQDTNSLQEEIFTSISCGNNMFMVGDMKQSIYRFRNSDPGIFKEKIDSYSKEEFSSDRKIILSKNFRSRKEILDSVNSVFNAIMSETVGEINYDTDQQLNHGNTEYMGKNDKLLNGYKSECCVILSENDVENSAENLKSAELEARFIAKKIRELKDNNFLVLDKITVKKEDENGDVIEENKTYYRPIQNKDIAILFSSHKNVSSTYQKELADFGIDCYAEVGGYFEKSEITMALSLLKTINNPYNDLPLIATMRSPLFSFSDDELCEIKLCGGECFYNSLKLAADSFEESLKNKCKSFLININKWRNYKKIMPCDKLIWTLYEETGLYSFCESVYGEDAASNLRLLFMRAKAFEDSGYKGLFNFIRYIGKMQKREEDLSSAVTLGENSDVVRLMTIHKSKGLEFPVVFLAGCSKGFNMTDTKRKILYHKELGFGANYINYENNFYDKTLQKNAVTLKINSEVVSEELRKLYVALTRAKEKLFVTAVCKKKNTEEFGEEKPVEYNKWITSIGSNGKFNEIQSASAGKYINWIAPVAIKDTDNWIFNIIPYSVASQSQMYQQNETKNEISSKYPDITITKKQYPYESDTVIPTKFSVTQIHQFNQTVYSDLINKPKFISEKPELSGADRGTAIHYIMQKYIPTSDNSVEKIDKFIKQLVDNEELSLEEANCVDPQIIADFYSSEIGLRIQKSKKVFREVPFEIEIELKDLISTNSCEKTILQGIIDCFFVEEDGIVLVDYKTDKYTNICEIKEKYRQQLQLYTLAIEKITSKVVKNQILYLFSTKNMIEYK